MSGARPDKGKQPAKQPAGAGRRLRRIRLFPSQEPFTILDTDDSLLACTPYPTAPPPQTVSVDPTSLPSLRPVAPDARPEGSQPPSMSTQTPDDMTQPPSDDEEHILEDNGSTGRSREWIHIEPRGHEFSAGSRCVRVIGNIIESKFNGPWRSYKQVPVEVKDLWFSIFEKTYIWNEEDRVMIRKVFDHIGSNCIKNRMYEARCHRKRPHWITPRSWDALQEQWNTQTHRLICEKNKKNHESDCDGQGFPLHVGGSITQMTHNERLKAKLGHEPTVSESFMHTHSRMNPRGEREWVDERSRNLHDKYREMYENPSSEGGSNSTPPPLATQIERWTDLVGGPKRGRVYGLGGMARAQASGSRGHGSNERERELQTEVHGLRQEMNDMRTSQEARLNEIMAAHAAQIEAMRSEMTAQMTEMRMMMAQQQPHHTGANLPYPSMPRGSTSQPPRGTPTGFVPTPIYPPRLSEAFRDCTQDSETERE